MSTAVAPSVHAPAIRLAGVRKAFGAITAVDGLDLEVPAGLCVGLLGPNGAGKSTTMRMLTGQARADSGSLEVLGHVLPRGSKAARARMGVVPQEDNLDIELSVRQNLDVFARLYRVPASERRAAVDRAIAIATLSARADTLVDELSGGMRRRLLLGRALVHRPDLLLLDEPTVGLDPQIRHGLWELIDELRAGGATLLMSTHYIEEAERLADLVAVMVAGRVVAFGRPADLVAAHVGERVLEVWGPPPERALAKERATRSGLLTRPAGPALAVLGVERVAAEDLPTGVLRPATLEDAFVVLTGAEAT